MFFIESAARIARFLAVALLLNSVLATNSHAKLFKKQSLEENQQKQTNTNNKNNDKDEIEKRDKNNEQNQQKLKKIVQIVEDGFYKDVSSDEIFENQAKGLLGGIDPYSAYLTEKDFLSVKTNLLGKFGGIGIEITKEKGFIKVISPIDESPS